MKLERCEKHNIEKVRQGKRWRCRECNKEHQRKWFHDNKEVQLARVMKNKEGAVEALSSYIIEFLLVHPCVICRRKRYFSFRF